MTQKAIFLVELTVPWEGNLTWAHERKLARYTELESHCQQRGWGCRTLPFEVGCRGIVAGSTVRFLRGLGAGSQEVRKVVRELQRVAESTSLWIWQTRNK